MSYSAQRINPQTRQGEVMPSPKRVLIQDALPNETGHVLRRLGYKTLGDLIKKTAQQISNLPGIGERRYERIQAVLKSHGLKFKGE